MLLHYIYHTTCCSIKCWNSILFSCYNIFVDVSLLYECYFWLPYQCSLLALKVCNSFQGHALALKEHSVKRAYRNKFPLGTSHQKQRSLHDQHKVNPAAILLAPSFSQISGQKLLQAVSTATLMAFLGRVMVTFILWWRCMLNLSVWSSLMLHQVIGPFSQAQTRLLSQQRVLETLSVPWTMLMQAMEIHSHSSITCVLQNPFATQFLVECFQLVAPILGMC